MTPGTRLGPYTITAQIGAGGMGEVYRARDTKLDRDVAIKILPNHLAADAERIARFEREARVLASLNHPHIAAIYGVEDGANTRALVLELVEGPTLADMLMARRLPIAEALAIASQIVDALGAAHEKGIVHRDLKPANVKVTAAGVVKVLDFGLARVAAHNHSVLELSQTPTTLTVDATREGVILGTVAYMSPEQAKGRPVDTGSDLWAFGVVLYEMLSGRQPFRADNLSETLARVLTLEPDWAALPQNTPAPIHRLLRRCLAKDVQRRLDSASAARLEIDDALQADSADALARVPRRQGRGLAAVVLLSVVAIGALVVTWAGGRSPATVSAPPSQFSIVPPVDEPLEPSAPWRSSLAISPDARYLAYRSATGRIMVRALDDLDAHAIQGVVSTSAPFFSPDSRWIGFADGVGLKKVPIAGGPPVTLARDLGTVLSGSWGDDGRIVFSSETGDVGLRSVSEAGGDVTTLTTIDASQDVSLHRDPWVLPEGRGVLFTAWRGAEQDRQVIVLDSHSSSQKSLIRGGAFAASYLQSGHLVYEASGTLFVVAFDLDRLEITGDPIRVSETLEVDTALGTASTSYAVSLTGTLAVRPSLPTTRSLVWVDRNGQELPVGAPPRPYVHSRLSPDGSRVALASIDEENDVWIWDFAREVMTRLTFGPNYDGLPAWTPDGRRVVFHSLRAGAVFNLYIQNADGSGVAERLTISPQPQYPNSMVPDGMAILGSESQPKTGYDIVAFPLRPLPSRSSDREVAETNSSFRESLISTPFAEYAANISPDGRHLAYQSEESGRFEIYVRPYPDVAQARWQISTGGGQAPVWARNGRELFYLDPTNTLMAVPVITSTLSFRAGKPYKLFDSKYWGNFYTYDVSPDGQRFLMLKEDRGSATRESAGSIVVLLGWIEAAMARAGK